MLLTVSICPIIRSKIIVCDVLELPLPKTQAIKYLKISNLAEISGESY